MTNAAMKNAAKKNTVTQPGWQRLLWVGVLALVTGISGGCGPSGPPRVEISGKVTWDGKPLETGTISFIPEEGLVGPMAGAQIVRGEYQIRADQGPTVGDHRVEIQAWKTSGQKEVAGVGGATTGPSAGGVVETIKMYIPEQYNTKSTLRATIEPDANRLDFDLKATP
jgi:hypothetical protein